MRETEKRKVNSEEGDEIGIQEIGKKKQRWKTGEIGRSREEKKRM